MRLTPAQARALGLMDRKPRTTHRTARGPYHTRCVDCGEVFTIRRREDEHVDETHHTRYELVL